MVINHFFHNGSNHFSENAVECMAVLENHFNAPQVLLHCVMLRSNSVSSRQTS